MGPHSIRLAWTMLARTTDLYWPSQKTLPDQGEALPLVVLTGSMAPRAATDGSAALTEGDPLGSVRIAPGTGDTGQRTGRPRPICQTDDWGIGYG